MKSEDIILKTNITKIKICRLISLIIIKFFIRVNGLKGSQQVLVEFVMRINYMAKVYFQMEFYSVKMV